VGMFLLLSSARRLVDCCINFFGVVRPISIGWKIHVFTGVAGSLLSQSNQNLFCATFLCSFKSRSSNVPERAVNKPTCLPKCFKRYSRLVKACNYWITALALAPTPAPALASKHDNFYHLVSKSKRRSSRSLLQVFPSLWLSPPSVAHPRVSIRQDL
jgi:hypothetical protein